MGEYGTPCQRSWNNLAGLPEFDWRQLLYIFLLLAGIGLALSLALSIWVIWKVKHINLPADAGLVVALRATPFGVVVLLDLLDFTLDFLAAPLAWTLLSYLGLLPLRGVTVLWALIPGTQALPIMTLAWLVVRLSRARPDPAHRL
jgi:hypothetical protein